MLQLGVGNVWMEQQYSMMCLKKVSQTFSCIMQYQSLRRSIQESEASKVYYCMTVKHGQFK